MSLLWIEGFESVGTTVDSSLSGSLLTKKYSSAPNTGYCYIKPGRTGGYSIEPATNYAASIQTYTLPVTSDIYVVGIGIRPNPNWGSGYTDLFRCYRNNTGYSGVGFRYNSPSKEITVLDRANTQFGSTARANLAPGVWNYVEIKWRDAVDGYVIIRVNGYEVLNVNHVDTTSTQGIGANIFQFTLGSSSTCPSGKRA